MKKMLLLFLLTVAVISGFFVGRLFRHTEIQAETEILFVKSKLNFRDSETQNVQIQKKLRVSDDPHDWLIFKRIDCE